jgi:WD40-like Beta Propeller Repeat
MVFPRAAAAALGFLMVSTSYPIAAPKFSEWSEPINLGPAVNTPFNDNAPTVSKDGGSLYFASNRPGQLGGNDLYVSQWDDTTSWWGPAVNLGPIVNTTATEFSPELSRDGHWLFFHSNRPGSFTPGLDIWVSYRTHIHDDFGWQTPVNLGPGVNAPGLDTAPSFFANDDVGVPQLFFGSDRANQGTTGPDVYVSDLMPDGTFGPARLVPELSSPQPDPGVSVRFDGLEVFLFSARPGGQGAGFDIWTSTRETVFHPWSEPTNLGPVVNTAFNENDPHIASDRQTLYFTSNRTGGMGGGDLYVTIRRKR